MKEGSVTLFVRRYDDRVELFTTDIDGNPKEHITGGTFLMPHEDGGQVEWDDRTRVCEAVAAESWDLVALFPEKCEVVDDEIAHVHKVMEADLACDTIIDETYGRWDRVAAVEALEMKRKCIRPEDRSLWIDLRMAAEVTPEELESVAKRLGCTEEEAAMKIRVAVVTGNSNDDCSIADRYLRISDAGNLFVAGDWNSEGEPLFLLF